MKIHHSCPRGGAPFRKRRPACVPASGTIVMAGIGNYSAKEPICRNGSPLSDESKDGIKRGLSVFPCRVGNGMESVEGIGAGIGTEAT